MTPDALSAAVTLHDQGRFTDAEGLYRAALAQTPDDPVALSGLGDVLTDSGRAGEALPLYQQVVFADPEAKASAAAYDGLAAILQDQGNLDGAIVYSKKAAILREDADGAYVTATALERLGRVDDALEIFAHVVRFKPDFSEAHAKIGTHLLSRGRLEEAEKSLRLAVEAKPDMAEAHCNLANVLRLRGDEDSALKSVRKAVELKPTLPEAHNLMGAIWKERRRPSDALAAFQKAATLKPDYAEAFHNAGMVLEEVGRVADATALLERAIAVRGDVPEFHQSLGTNLLLRGDMQRGWAEFEWRRLSGRNPASRRFPQPLWDGSDLTGRTILLHAELGLSDTILFARYASAVAARNGRVVVECNAALTALIATAPGVSEVVALGEPLPHFEVQFPLLSLPTIFGSDPAAVPPPPYLRPQITPALRDKLPAGKTVGLIWGPEQSPGNDRNRFLPPARLGVFNGLAANFVAVRPTTTPVPEGSIQITDLSTDAAGWPATAELLAQLDLVVGIDVPATHLAAAMGRLTWFLLPAVPDWKWGLTGRTSPWYPDATLFRQKSPGEWTPLVAEVKAALEQRFLT